MFFVLIKKERISAARDVLLEGEFNKFILYSCKYSKYIVCKTDCCRLDSLGNPQLASSYQMGSWSSKFNDLPLEANPPLLPRIPNCQAFITPEEQTQFKMKKRGPISFEKIDYKVKDAMGEVVLTIRPFDQYCFTKGR